MIPSPLSFSLTRLGRDSARQIRYKPAQKKLPSSRPAVKVDFLNIVSSEYSVSQLLQILTQCCEINASGERAEGFVGTNVGSRLFAADMLFTGLQRQDKTALAIFIHSCADDPSGNPAHIFFPGGKNTQIRAAVIERIAETLAFANDKISAGLSRRLQNAQARAFRETGHEKCLSFMAESGNRLNIFDNAEKIGALH